LKTKEAVSVNSRHKLYSLRNKVAFSLVEVVIAIGVFSFCLLILIALVPVGLTSNKSTRDRTIVADLCSSLETDMRETPTANTTSPLYQIPMPTAGATTSITLYDNYLSTTNTFSTTRMPDSQYRFTITLTPPAATSPNDPVTANILASWPAAASTNIATGLVNVNVGINRF